MWHKDDPMLSKTPALSEYHLHHGSLSNMKPPIPLQVIPDEAAPKEIRS